MAAAKWVLATVAALVAVVLAVFSRNIVDFVWMVDVLKDAPKDDHGRPLLLSASQSFFPEGQLVRRASHRDNSECTIIDRSTFNNKWLTGTGYEDVIPVRPGVAITCAGGVIATGHRAKSDDRYRGDCAILRHAPSVAPNGQKLPITVEKLTIKGFPDKFAFHPHGMNALADGKTIAIVNHAYERGGERVEFFTLDVDGKQLVYTHSAVGDVLVTKFNGILNDLVLMSPTSFFVTSWMHRPRVNGAKATKLRTFFDIFMKKFESPVLLCNVAAAAKPAATNAGDRETTCQELDQLIMANGIGMFKLPQTGATMVAVVELMMHRLVVYRYCPETNSSFPLCDGKHVDLIHAFDNIIVESVTEEKVRILGASMRYVYKAPVDEQGQAAPGGMTEVDLYFDHKGRLTSTAQRDVVQIDGVAFQGISGGVRFSEPTRDYVVMGTFRDPGLMICMVDNADD